jgi:hypothetical protein
MPRCSVMAKAFHRDALLAVLCMIATALALFGMYQLTNNTEAKVTCLETRSIDTCEFYVR